MTKNDVDKAMWDKYGELCLIGLRAMNSADTATVIRYTLNRRPEVAKILKEAEKETS